MLGGYAIMSWQMSVRMVLAVLFPERQWKSINASYISCAEVLKRCASTATPKCYAKSQSQWEHYTTTSRFTGSSFVLTT